MDENEVTEEGREERARYQRRPFTFDRTVRIFFTIAVVLAVLWLVGYLKGVLLPFVVACLICYILEPVVKWNMRWTRCRKRFLPVILTLLEATVLIGGLIMVTVPYLVSECQDMALTIKKFATTQISIPYLSESWHRIIRENIDFDELSRLLSRDEWKQLAKTAISSSWSFLTSSVAFIAGVVSWLIVVLYVIFIMLDYERLMLSFKQLVPYSHRQRTFRIAGDIKNTMQRYFRGQFLIAMLVGLMFAAGFLLIDLPMGVALGLFIGVLNLVPYLQLISLPITAVLCMIWTMTTGGSFWLIFWEAMAVYVVVQCIQDLLLTPKIMGNAMGLNPAVILLSLSIWGSLLGFMGFIIALPLTTLILSYYNRYIIQRGDDIPADSRRIQ